MGRYTSYTIRCREWNGWYELRQLVPEARFTMAHGQMTENQLESAMLQFYEREADVLVCSTIVENGVDIPLPIP